MKRIRKLFETPKNTAITVVCIAAVLVILGSGTVFAANAIAKNTSIGEENAQNFAFADAGVDPVSAKNVHTQFDFEQGTFVYEVEFIADGTKYEYWIKASNGSILKKEMEVVSMDEPNTETSAQITFEEAEQKALADAGLTASEVTFEKTKMDTEDGISVYDIEFYTETMKYEYEIYADSGKIYSKSKETIAASETEKNQNQQDANQNTQEPEQTLPVSNQTPQPDTSQTSQTDANQTSQPDTDQTSQTAANQTPQGTDQSNGGQSASNQPQQNGDGQISLDTAKNTALADAGLSSSDVTFTKEKLDYEDGVAIYEIEFYTSTHEYEYEINAATGAIRSRDVEEYKTSTGQSEDTGNSGSYIGIDNAKSIAVSHAGFSVADVSFSKAKLDIDDGQTVYEIEFYKDGYEYEYKIDAVTGSILEYDTDNDGHHYDDHYYDDHYYDDHYYDNHHDDEHHD